MSTSLVNLLYWCRRPTKHNEKLLQSARGSTVTGYRTVSFYDLMSRARSRSPLRPEDQEIGIVNRIESCASDLYLRLQAPPRQQPLLPAYERLKVHLIEADDSRHIRLLPVAVVQPRVQSDVSSDDSDVDDLIEWAAEYARNRQGFHHLHPIQIASDSSDPDSSVSSGPASPVSSDPDSSLDGTETDEASTPEHH